MKRTKKQLIGNIFLGILYFFIGIGLGLVILLYAYRYVGKGFVQRSVRNLVEGEEVFLIGNTFDPKSGLSLLETYLVSITSVVDTNKVGTYQVTYQVFEGETYYRSVKVVDREPPTIQLVGEEKVIIGSIETWNDPGVVAFDDTDGDISENVTREIIPIDERNYKVLYRVFDSSGYERTARRYVEIARGIVCLTFDDGPSIENTEQVLDILKENDVKATFFILAFDEEKKGIVAREFAEGHTVGLHGYSHEYSEVYTDIDTLMNNFYALDDLIKSEVNEEYQPQFIRFPGGSSNKVSKKFCQGIMTEAVWRVTAEGYVYVDWNVDSKDAGGAKSAEEIFKNVTDNIEPHRTNIVLMHDEAHKVYTVEALQSIIDWCKENGYVLEPITSGTEIVHHEVIN